MYECLIVIPTYNPGQFIFKNLELYRQLDPDKYKVLLIDNCTNNQQSLDILNKVNEEFTAEKNMFGGGYEPGALLHAVNKYQSKQVFLTQDSMELIDLNFLLTPDENIIKSYLIEDRPARFLSPDQIAWIKERFNNRIFEGLSNGNALVSSTFLGSREAIDKIIQQDILVESKLPRFKRDQECWERVMGIAFDSNGYTHKCFPECFKKTLMGRQ
jgi:glycosyltransferase involved in cell wall biosynthesis